MQVSPDIYSLNFNVTVSISGHELEVGQSVHGTKFEAFFMSFPNTDSLPTKQQFCCWWFQRHPRWQRWRSGTSPHFSSPTSLSIVCLTCVYFLSKHQQAPVGFPQLRPSGLLFKSACLLLTSGSPIVFLSHFIRQISCSHSAIVQYIVFLVSHRSLSMMSLRAFLLRGLISNGKLFRMISGITCVVIMFFRSWRLRTIPSFRCFFLIIPFVWFYQAITRWQVPIALLPMERSFSVA